MDVYIQHCQLHAMLSGEKGLLADLAGDAPDNILSISKESELEILDAADDPDEAIPYGLKIWHRLSGIAALVAISAITAATLVMMRPESPPDRWDPGDRAYGRSVN